MTKHLITFSGGKDSLATLCWAKQNLEHDQFDVVFCDTGWESHKTYQHIKDIERWLGKEFIVLKSSKYKDLLDLFIQKKRVASTKARFCTEEMKVKPMIDHILTLKCDVVVIQGVRAEESLSRRMLDMNDEYFKFYEQPFGKTKKGEPKFHTYRKKEVLSHINQFTVDVFRPIIKWTAQQVFEFIFENGLKANPLYYEGFSRVGCFPCIMCRHSEIKLIIANHAEKIDEIRALEETLNSTFFPPRYIPKKYCTKKVVTKDGRIKYAPSIDDVVRYLTDEAEGQQYFFEQKAPGCISVYNICESPQ